MSSPRDALAALRAARKFIASSRCTLIYSHSVPPGRLSLSSVTDPGALQWIAEHDVVLSKLDSAIKAMKGATPCPSSPRP